MSSCFDRIPACDRQTDRHFAKLPQHSPSYSYMCHGKKGLGGPSTNACRMALQSNKPVSSLTWHRLGRYIAVCHRTLWPWVGPNLAPWSLHHLATQLFSRVCDIVHLLLYRGIRHFVHYLIFFVCIFQSQNQAESIIYAGLSKSMYAGSVLSLNSKCGF